MISEDVITIFLRLSDFFPIAIFFSPWMWVRKRGSWETWYSYSEFSIRLTWTAFISWCFYLYSVTVNSVLTIFVLKHIDIPYVKEKMIGEVSCLVSHLSFLSDIIGIKLLMGDTFKKIVLWSSIREFAIHFNICSLIYIKDNAIYVQLTIHGQCNVISRSCKWNKLEGGGGSILNLRCNLLCEFWQF